MLPLDPSPPFGGLKRDNMFSPLSSSRPLFLLMYVGNTLISVTVAVNDPLRPFSSALAMSQRREVTFLRCLYDVLRVALRIPRILVRRASLRLLNLGLYRSYVPTSTCYQM